MTCTCVNSGATSDGRNKPWRTPRTTYVQWGRAWGGSRYKLSGPGGQEGGPVPYYVLQLAKRTTPKTARTKSSNTQRTENKATDVVIHQHSRKLLKMDILMSETCSARNKWNKIASVIKLVFHSSAMWHMFAFLGSVIICPLYKLTFSDQAPRASATESFWFYVNILAGTPLLGDPKELFHRGPEYWPFNPSNAELNPICHLLALLGAHHIFHVSGLRVKVKGKAVPLQVWSDPEASRKLWLPDFMTTAQNGGIVISLTHRPPLPPGNAPGTHFC